MKAQSGRSLRLAIGAGASLAWRRAALTFCLGLCTLGLGPSANAQDHKATFITIDAPGASPAPFYGTEAYAITPAGEIMGNYVDATSLVHGFLRSKDGAFTTIDAPGAGSEVGSFQGTIPESITPAGAIAGFYNDANYVNHGFLRAEDGTFTTFDAPGAGTGIGQGTYALDINAAGEVAGQYLDSSTVWHGFVRAPDGTITVFDAPGAGTGSLQGTFLSTIEGLNAAGAISGGYSDSNGVFHGFVRAPDGVITSFDAPGAGTGSGQGTSCGGINPAGTTVGNYIDGSGVNHGYVRAADGTFSTFNVAGAGTASGQGTLGENISTPGTVDGYFIDSNGADHAFVFSKGGEITTFDAPGAGTGQFQGTTAGGINPKGAIAGTYIDANNGYHGYLRNP
jgi:hypothetical protein